MNKKASIMHSLRLLSKGIQILFATSGLYAILIVVLNIISGLISPLNLIVYQHLLDCIVEMLDTRSWLSSGLFFLIMLSLLSIASFVLNSIIDFIKQVFSDKLDLHITEKVLQKSIILPMETFDNAEIYNHINTAVTRTSSSCLTLLESISEIIYSTVKGLSYLFIIVNFSWPIATVSLISIIPLLHLSVTINRYWYKIYMKRVEKNRLIQYLKMLIVKNSCIKEIKLYNVGEKIIDFIVNNFKRFLSEDVKARKGFLRKKTFVQILDNTVTFGVKLWLLALAIGKGCSLGTIVLFFNSLDDLKISYNQLIRQFSALQNSLQYLESLETLEHEKADYAQEGRSFNNHFKKIELRNVSFQYPGCDKYVLKDISLTFERGKTYFLVGFNGSGKTTLIKLLLRLYQPTEGQILIDGVDIQNISLNQYYANISAIFQDFIEYPFNVYENIVVRAADEDPTRFETVLDEVGMRGFVNSLPNKEHTLLMRDWTGGIDLSQGQWQKLAIARCIYGNSIISILDEPFSSIDAEAENNIISNIRKHSGTNLMIYITHRFSSISRDDQIIVLKDGSIVEQGTHEELIQNKNIYYRLYDSQKVD